MPFASSRVKWPNLHALNKLSSALGPQIKAASVRKSLWIILAVLLVVIAAPVLYADTR
jgi:hypothetical protein